MSADPPDRSITRRSFLKKTALAAGAAAGLISCNPVVPAGRRKFPGRIMGADWKTGHMLLEGRKTAPSATVKTGIVIVGGGIAGLSAARELAKNGCGDFLLLELGGTVGGNAASGANAVSAYPWGAHYVPIPGEEAVFTRELFRELGIIEGYDSKGLPIYNEFYLCADPMERLFIHGRWQEGLVPNIGISGRDKQQYAEFFGMMEGFRRARGADGRRAFAIPLELSSADERFRRFDRMSMRRFMSVNGWDSEPLLWYTDYCCRDDYGSTLDDVSAWAGIHYFAARDGRASNAEPQAVVTWPEGNGWIVRRMAEPLHDRIRCSSCVLNIGRSGSDIATDVFDSRTKTVTRVVSQAVVYAAPRFTAMKTIQDLRDRPSPYVKDFGYAPWVIANITVRGIPAGKGAALSWDNVVYKGESLGYVDAGHQDISYYRDKTVMTYYKPLVPGDPAAERKRALGTGYDIWAEMIVRELSAIHPGIEQAIEELNVWIWGHAMIRPVPGFIWGEARQAALKPLGRIHFAHSDMSGISIFEEAQYRGIMAARAAVNSV
ncbi:MAG: FAD-dependent oxidoreductase [Nitrospiraceae bacterium]|nr:FAD-dependent oxidoreductase [Nitrospiraceae bacterium]